MKQKKLVSMIGALVLVISAVLTVGGCKHSNNPVPVTGVSLDKTEHKVARKKSFTLKATVAPANAAEQGVTWASDNGSVATVDENGKVTGLTEGTAVITATTKDGGKTASCTVNVGIKVTIKIDTADPLLEDRGVQISANTVNNESFFIIEKNGKETEVMSRDGIWLKTTADEITVEGDITFFDCNNSSSQGFITELDLHELSNLKELNCCSNKISKLDLQGLTKLEIIDCGDNPIEELNITGLVNLKELACYNTEKLETLNVQDFPKLKILSCSNNKLKNLDLSGLTLLKELYVSDNELTSLIVDGLPQLTDLQCDKNKLQNLDLTNMPRLYRLNCCENELTSLNLDGTLNLHEVICYKNQLTNLDLSGRKRLTKVECYENELTNLNVKGATKLKELSCYNNKLLQAAFTALFADLPDYTGKDAGSAVLYTEETGVTENNYTGFTADELKVAKDKNWSVFKRVKIGYSSSNEDL